MRAIGNGAPWSGDSERRARIREAVRHGSKRQHAPVEFARGVPTKSRVADGAGGPYGEMQLQNGSVPGD